MAWISHLQIKRQLLSCKATRLRQTNSKAEAAFKAQMKQAQELREEAKRFAQEEGTTATEGRAGVASRQAAELEEQAKQIRDLTIQAAERAEEEAKIAAEQAKAKEAAAEALRIQQEQQRVAEARLQKKNNLQSKQRMQNKHRTNGLNLHAYSCESQKPPTSKRSRNYSSSWNWSKQKTHLNKRLPVSTNFSMSVLHLQKPVTILMQTLQN